MGAWKLPDLFLVLNMTISLVRCAHRLEILCSTLEINLIFPRTHDACTYYSLYIILVSHYHERAIIVSHCLMYMYRPALIYTGR
jgi:hypothetical protein